MNMKKKMVNITLSLPNIIIEGIEEIVNLGLFHSRSEFIRDAIRCFIFEEIKFKNKIGGLIE